MTVLDVDAAVTFLTSGREEGAPPPGAVARELTRSPAAARVGALARADGLFLAHFEHRAALSVHPDAAVPTWVDGVLPEEKYGSFWHELPIGSFHPGHRAKWGAHELCHGLVGSAWAPGAPPLYLATAGRLAELVPVVLWYFLDEVGLARCPDHDGPQFRGFCLACEQAAGVPTLPDEGSARAWVQDASRFVERELAAVARTRRLGRPVAHVWGSLDLCTDGLAYAANHGDRLRGPAFAAWAERFVEPDIALFDDLDALEHRVVEVLRGIAEGRPVAPWVGDPAAGRRRWIAMDVGARLAQVWAHTGRPAQVGAVLDTLADDHDAAGALGAYAEVCEAIGGPSPEEVFAVGYPVEGVPTRWVPGVADGLETVVPLTLALFEDAGLDPVPGFLANDAMERVPLGQRFAAFLEQEHAGPVAELARYEAMLRAAAPDPLGPLLGDGEGVQLAPGALVQSFAVDPVALSDAVDAGSIEGRSQGGRLVLPDVEPAPTTLVVARDGYGDRLVVEVPGATEAQVRDFPDTLDPVLQDSLRELGVLGAVRWPTEPASTG